MDRARGYYAKWNKSDRERQILYNLTCMWNLKTKTKLTVKENRLLELKVVGKNGWGHQRYKLKYKINMLWESNLQHGDYIAYLKDTKRIDLRSSYCKKKI